MDFISSVVLVMGILASVNAARVIKLLLDRNTDGELIVGLAAMSAIASICGTSLVFRFWLLA